MSVCIYVYPSLSNTHNVLLNKANIYIFSQWTWMFVTGKLLLLLKREGRSIPSITFVPGLTLKY